MVKLRPTKGLELPVALQDALRHAGISTNHDSIEALQDSLLHEQVDRTLKLQDHYESTSTSTHERLAERSGKADEDRNIVYSALYKHTPYHQVSLTSRILSDQLKSLEHDLEDKDRELLEADGDELSLNDPKVRAFITRYSK